MTSHPLPSNNNRNFGDRPNIPDGDPGLRKFADRLAQSIERDTLIQQTTDDLRNFLQVDRVLLYYFYRQWKGRVIFESLSSNLLSIFGETGPDECFNNEYAALYLAGRVKAIADIESEIINPCHRDFLKTLQVRANLVVPVLNSGKLWGLLIAHHCQNTRPWLPSEIEAMRKGAETLANSPAIRNN